MTVSTRPKTSSWRNQFLGQSDPVCDRQWRRSEKMMSTGRLVIFFPCCAFLTKIGAKMKKKIDQAIGAREALKQLGRIEVIEGLLDFDFPSLVVFADQAADERQRLTQMAMRSGEIEH
jgi:hypothetical protein